MSNTRLLIFGLCTAVAAFIIRSGYFYGCRQAVSDEKARLGPRHPAVEVPGDIKIPDFASALGDLDPRQSATRQRAEHRRDLALEAAGNVVYVRDPRTRDVCFAFDYRGRGLGTISDCDRVRHLLINPPAEGASIAPPLCQSGDCTTNGHQVENPSADLPAGIPDDCPKCPSARRYELSPEVRMDLVR